MDVLDSIENVERKLRFLTYRIDILVKLTELTCLYLIEKDSHFEKILEKGCQGILNDGT
jgi:hypothetical protein